MNTSKACIFHDDFVYFLFFTFYFVLIFVHSGIFASIFAIIDYIGKNGINLCHFRRYVQNIAYFSFSPPCKPTENKL